MTLHGEHLVARLAWGRPESRTPLRLDILALDDAADESALVGVGMELLKTAQPGPCSPAGGPRTTGGTSESIGVTKHRRAAWPKTAWQS
jgi:hypothetical protein